MVNNKHFFSRKSLVVVMLFIGGILLVYALLRGASDSSIPDWVPVNEPLHEALESLTSPSSASALPSQAPSGPFAASGIGENPIPESATHNAKSQQESSQPEGESNPSQQSPGNQSSQPESRLESLSGQPESTSSQSALIDLNHATQAELETLPGIGPSKAKAIIAYRVDNNGFRKVEQLLEVKGIGEKMLERVLALVRVTQMK